ncbi:MAG: recombinase RmuC [Caulobacter sp. 12-67-6]|nr:MAG: recombinase RmuC [Caulobacter sp. 12-67-6]OYX67118.1 MAG: recombinase RmuC [Caulobacter sp. 32-67-35]OYX93487.1 MAG: recombinase RmuC [Caulobacter sp. 35-67-4]OZA72034.1 MAG: recombinase RmuC [Caulobacter sp. 39-67-4]HQR90665.1 DNA recombination protein RmuC [Caulobacter sp.]
MNFSDPFLILAAVFAAIAVAAILWALASTKRASAADARAWDLNARLVQADERARLLEDQAATQAELIRAQAAQQATMTANTVAEALIKRADENFRSREMLSQQRLEAQLKPVAETLAKFEAQVTAVEKSRAEETGGLKAQIAALMEASTATQFEARKLSAALRRGAGVQGRWGEQTLRNVLEAAGLNKRFDFEEQFSVDTEEGRRRPDVKVRMPGGAVFVIDAKCSLNAFLEAQEMAEELPREAALLRHAQSVRAHMTSLSAKTYWDQFAAEGSPDFVAMFVPGDSFLAAALERLPDLMTEAMDKRVLLVTPTTLFALCKAVAYGWRVEDQAKNAANIVAVGRELYKRVAVMGAHAGAVGKALESAVGKYNQFVGSLESQVLTQARRFEDLSVDHEGKEIAELAPVEGGVRALTKLAPQAAMGQSPTLTLGNETLT